jgi:hypothetical protein
LFVFAQSDLNLIHQKDVRHTANFSSFRVIRLPNGRSATTTVQAELHDGAMTEHEEAQRIFHLVRREQAAQKPGTTGSGETKVDLHAVHLSPGRLYDGKTRSSASRYFRNDLMI